MSHDDHTSLAADLCTENGHFTSGIVVFSSSRKPLYMNAAAQQLLLRLNRTEMGDSAILRSVDNLLDEILLVLRIGSSDRGWKQLATRRFPRLQTDRCWSERSAFPTAGTVSDH